MHCARVAWSRSTGAVTAEMPFFVSSKAQGLGLRQVARVFAALRQQLGWVNRGAHDQPRIHDLRHTFAVRRMLLWQARGAEIDQAMLALSTYMGHAKISNTYWYLTAVPELMAVAAGKFELFTFGPEVEDAKCNPAHPASALVLRPSPGLLCRVPHRAARA